MYARLSDINSFAISQNDEYCLDYIVMIVTDDNKYYCAIFNSKTIYFYFRLVCVVWGKEGIKWFGNSFDAIPLYQIDYSNPTEVLIHEEIKNYVDQILSLKKSDPQSDTSILEAEIDRLVYELYGLTDEEIRLVEESVEGK